MPDAPFVGDSSLSFQCGGFVNKAGGLFGGDTEVVSSLL